MKQCEEYEEMDSKVFLIESWMKRIFFFMNAYKWKRSQMFSMI